MQGGTGSEAPLQETATAVLEESGKETPAQPRSFEDLRGENRSSFDKSDEEKTLEAELEDTPEGDDPKSEKPDESKEEAKPNKESGNEKQKPETPSGGEKPKGGIELEKPTDTQTEDGYVAEVQLVVDGKPVNVPIDQLYNDVEADLFTPGGPNGGVTTVKGLEPLRVLAQKGLYTDERNQKANQMMEEAKALTGTFQQRVVQEAQKIANGYLQEWMEKNLGGGQVDPNNPLYQAPYQDPNQSGSIANQYLLTQIHELRKQQTDWQTQQAQEREKIQAEQVQMQKLKDGEFIANNHIMPFREKFKTPEGGYDDDTFSNFADVVANRTMFRVQQIKQERQAQDPEFPGLTKEEVAIITGQEAREVYQADQKRVQKLIDNQLATMRKTVRTGGPRGGGGAPMDTEETPQEKKKTGPRTFESLRQSRPR